MLAEAARHAEERSGEQLEEQRALLDGRELELRAREAELTGAAAALEARATVLAEQEAALREASRRTASEQAALEQRERSLAASADTAHVELEAAKPGDVAARARVLEDMAARLDLRNAELGFRLLGESNVVLEMAMTRRLRVVRFVQSVLRVLAHCLEHRIASRVRVDAMGRYERLVDQLGEWVQDRILVPLPTGNTCRRLERPATGKHRDSAQ